MQKIPDSLLNTPVDGLNLSGATLGAQLSGRPTLLVFLRHFG